MNYKCKEESVITYIPYTYVVLYIHRIDIYIVLHAYIYIYNNN